MPVNRVVPIEEIKALNAQYGGHFFEAAALVFESWEPAQSASIARDMAYFTARVKEVNNRPAWFGVWECDLRNGTIEAANAEDPDSYIGHEYHSQAQADAAITKLIA